MSQRRSGPALFTPDPQSPIFAVSPRRPTRAVAAAPIVVVVGLTCGRTLISPLASPPPFSLPPAPQGGAGTLSHRCQTSMQTADLCLLLSLSSYFSLFLFLCLSLDICHRCKIDISADCKCVCSSRKTAIWNQLCPSFSSASHFQLQRKLKPADRGKVGTVTGQRKLPASTHPFASLMVMMMMMVMVELSLRSASLPLQLTGKLAS